MMSAMAVARVYSIRVTDETVGESLEHLMVARAQVYANQDGFVGLELLAPTDGGDEWLFITRWADDASFDQFVASPAFTDHPGEDRIAAFGGPETPTDVRRYRVVGDGST
jgi:heme-degrading monooxygenase HmoA